MLKLILTGRETDTEEQKQDIILEITEENYWWFYITAAETIKY